MARNTEDLSYKSIVKDEYEIQLYGFSLKEFTKENFMFVKGNIKKAVEDLNVSFNHLLGDVKPELHQKIEDVTKSIVTEINNNCQEGIIAVNKVIEDNLTIPENVLLYSDRLHATNPTQADVDVLSEECQRLEQSVKENAFFIHALNAELQSYEQIQEIIATEDFVTSKAKELLNDTLEVDLLLHTASKLQPLK